MTKNINNNEIETIDETYEEGYEETMNGQYEYNDQPKKTRRNFLKPLIIGALAVVVTGGAELMHMISMRQHKELKFKKRIRM